MIYVISCWLFPYLFPVSLFLVTYIPLVLVFRVRPAPAGPIVLSAQRNRSLCCTASILIYVLYCFVYAVLQFSVCMHIECH